MKSSTHKIGYRVKLKLQITQHSRDYQLINSLVKEKKNPKYLLRNPPPPPPHLNGGGYLGCGILIEVFNRPAVDFIVTASEAKFVGSVGRPTFSDIDSNPKLLRNSPACWIAFLYFFFSKNNTFRYIYMSIYISKLSRKR